MKLKTLTPIHIGTGIDFQGSVEYLWFPNHQQAVVIDDAKVLAIIGEEQINHWVSCIEKGEPLMPLLEQRSKHLTPEMVAKRIITFGAGAVDAKKVLREQLHSANGKALLPGSSLKGALRTVVWADLFNKNPELAADVSNLGKSFTDRKSGKERFEYNDETVAKLFFGKDPNHDIFRLWQIGDVMFDVPTAIYRTEVVNLYGKSDYKIKQEITQQIEAIPAGVGAEAQWRYNEVLQKQADKSNLFNKNAAGLKPEQLIPTVNKHTRFLVKSEIKFWTGKGNPEALGTYLDHLQRIDAMIEECPKDSCIMRLGWGTGFRTMTGDWHTNLSDDDYFDLVANLRPTHDETIEFPKTTRVIAGGEPLGFIKITL